MVSRTWQAGLRGAARPRRAAAWTGALGAYRSDNDDDIVALASALQGRGSYANVPRTRRQGLEAEINFKADRWMAYASASQVEATYRFSGVAALAQQPLRRRRRQCGGDARRPHRRHPAGPLQGRRATTT